MARYGVYRIGAGEFVLDVQSDIVDGLENAPKALLRLFHSENFSKQLVRIREYPN